jgi:hypothetical protein
MPLAESLKIAQFRSMPIAFDLFLGMQCKCGMELGIGIGTEGEVRGWKLEVGFKNID